MKRWSMCMLLGVFLLLGGTPEAVAQDTRPRLLVLTDIGGDPDDEQSLIRLLLYANELDVEGLIATAIKGEVKPHLITERIEAYRQVRPNLVRHAEGYPPADTLLARVRTGSKTRFMTSVGPGRSTEGSDHIIEVVDRPDPRPVWITIWGGATDLAQALWDVRATRSEADVAAFLRKLRVYEIGGQDDAGAWIARTFPDLLWLRSVDQFQAISVRKRVPFPPEVTGANIATFTSQWVDEHVQSHGPLGALYPERIWKYEGDTPAFLYLIPNGLSDPEQVHYGGWGGRFNQHKTKNVDTFAERFAAHQIPHRDYWMRTEAEDTWTYGDVTYPESRHAALFRWREASQHDFAARMDWSVTPTYEAANHNPVAAVDGDTSRQVVRRRVRTGELLALRADASSDPDGDALAYRWFYYPEPGTHEGTVALRGANRSTVRVVAPEVDKATEIHLLLEVRDDGTPPLYAYRRVVLTVIPGDA